MTKTDLSSSVFLTKIAPQSEQLSIGRILGVLKSEQPSLGSKPYKQLAATLVAMPSEPSIQSEEQKNTLYALEYFARNARYFRKLVATPRVELGVLEETIVIERNRAVFSLKKDLLAATSTVLKVIYDYSATKSLAEKLGNIYLKNSDRFLARISDSRKQNLS